jgi:hypothetical protein
VVVDIPPIRDDEPLIRHVHPDQWNDQENRPTSAAFADAELSVDREEMRDVNTSCRLRPEWGFTRFPVHAATGLGFDVRPDPLGCDTLPLDTTPSLDYNPGHAVVLGGKNRMRKLRDLAAVVFPPGDCP